MERTREPVVFSVVRRVERLRVIDIVPPGGMLLVNQANWNQILWYQPRWSLSPTMRCHCTRPPVTGAAAIDDMKGSVRAVATAIESSAARLDIQRVDIPQLGRRAASCETMSVGLVPKVNTIFGEASLVHQETIRS